MVKKIGNPLQKREVMKDQPENWGRRQRRRPSSVSRILKELGSDGKPAEERQTPVTSNRTAMKRTYNEE